MPWLTIIVWLVSYFISSKSGMSKGQAALVATGAAGAAYYLADPSNTDNVLGVSMGQAKTVPGDLDATTTAGGETVANPGILSTLGSLGTTTIDTIGKTAQAWGPVGTVGAVTAASGLRSDNNKRLWIGGAALVAVLLLK